MIAPELVENAAYALVLLGEGNWSRVHSEVQDDGNFVLFSIESSDLTPTTIEPFRKSILDSLNRLVPKHANHPLGSWMVVFTRDGHVLESVFPAVP
jgi:hypothetical protein